jgi:hypothetical protein
MNTEIVCYVRGKVGRSKGEGGQSHACVMTGVPSHDTLSIRRASVVPMTDNIVL